MTAQGGWQHLIGWFLERRVVVLVLVVLLIGAGLVVSPFSRDLGPLPLHPVPVDALPDIGENQQIVFTAWDGRSPRDVEDQVTYPLTTALLGVAGVRTVRSTSMLGFSTIYLIFEEGVDFYWARARVLEKLASLPSGIVPDGVTPTLGPDATALGQVFWYTLQGRDLEGNVVGGWDPDELRSIQDWQIRYALQAVGGVSEVASVGGFVREYQIDVDPEALRAAGVSLEQVADAVRRSNLDVGARTLEINSVEYVIRSLGFLKGVEDLEETVVVARENTPIRLRDVAHVGLGPALRRGALDDAGAPAVGGVVVARYLENPRQVIEAVKARLAEIQLGLPRRTLADGTVSQVTVVPFYDRTILIDETLNTLSTSLIQQVLITVLVVLVMIGNLRSSLLIASVLPLGVLATFVIMKVAGVDANIMALGGIAVAIGTMVDVSIVFVEAMEQGLTDDMTVRERLQHVRNAAAEVAPAVLTSVLTTVVSFLPVFGLSDAELRLFAPLAFTKTFAMSASLVLAIVVIPSFAFLVLRRRPAADPRGFVRGLFRMEHARDGLVVVLGLALFAVNALAALLVVGLGIWRLVRPSVDPARVELFTRLENVLTLGVVTVLLTLGWMPLGEGAGWLANGLLVAVLLVGVLLPFWFFERSYPVLLATLLRWRKLFLVVPALAVVLGVWAWSTLGREYMPPFDEGAFLYMPTTMPHASLGEAQAMLSTLDAAIATVPEVDRVVGKLGRVDSALDPAPVSMIETIVTYHPEYGVDAEGNRVRQWRDHIRGPDDIWQAITEAAQHPGVTGAPQLMPINARIVMLQSGMRAPMGIKVRGPDLPTIEAFGLELEALLRQVPAVRPESVFADRVVGKPYLEIVLDRSAIGRYGLRVVDVQDVLQVALGGKTLTRTVEGRERYPVRVRMMREERDSLEALERLTIPTPAGEYVPLSQLARLEYVRGPQMIKAEDTFLTSYVLFDRVRDIAEVEAVEAARAVLNAHIASGELVVPDGVSFVFAGAYENQVRSERRLRVLVPVALAFVFILLYLQFRRVSTTAIVYSGVAVAVSGGFMLLWLYGQPWFLHLAPFGVDLQDLFQVGTVNLSVAVWIGVIALVGIATDDGVVMATYLDQTFAERAPGSIDEVRERTLEAGIRRVRPCLMTTATTLLALLPVITSQGRGSDVMVPLALPILGGMLIELMTLFVVPVLYCANEEFWLERP